ncbi:MAG: 50S ribosomal protein L4 [Synergistaceae bacterium]|jgi:large subunit ribosomal protein L4|nr:50S ribosomal protein L4 [Synergistaceae bacterium]
MPTMKLINFEGEVVGSLELSDAVFGAPIHVPAMHQVVVAHLANARQGTASAKTRGEVSGGGRKPFRQKHTGRARAGSTRSPLWLKGGVAHGPKPRDYSQKVNRKVRQLAMRSALSLKATEDRMLILENGDFGTHKTKAMLAFLGKVEATRKPLMVIDESNANLYRSVANIPGAKVLHVDSLNVYDILNHEHLIMTLASAQKLQEVYGR